MPIEADQILSVLDRCCDAFSFPMLDNGYFYLAATRLSLYRTRRTGQSSSNVSAISASSLGTKPFHRNFRERALQSDVPEKYVKDSSLRELPRKQSITMISAFNPMMETSGW